jgi:predicted transposase YdaD
MTVEMKKEADTMCTYGQSILEEGMEKGMRQGMQKGLEKGRLEGKQEGLQEGRQEERESNIVAMLKEKIPMETISRITHYSLDQIQKLGKLHGLL